MDYTGHRKASRGVPYVTACQKTHLLRADGGAVRRLRPNHRTDAQRRARHAVGGGFWALLLVCSVPYLAKDLICVAAAALLAVKLRPQLERYFVPAKKRAYK